MSINDVKDFLINSENYMKNNHWTPDETVTNVSFKNDYVFKRFGMMIDNDLARNGILNRKQAKKIDETLPKDDNWFEVYRPWGHTHDLIRPVDKFSVSIALDQMILAIELGDYKETEKDYNLEKYGNKEASLSDC